MKKYTARNITVTAMLTAVSIVLYMLPIKLPFMPSFLSLDFSDLPALLASFALGPLYGFLVCLLKNGIHLLVSHTMWVGELSNFILGSVFTLTAGLVYRRNKTRKTAALGGFSGALVMGFAGVFSNYFIIYPLYAALAFPMEAILGMYQAIFPWITNLWQALFLFNLPFTFVKGAACVLLALLIYKPLSPILKGKR